MATFLQCSRYCCLFLIRRKGPRQEDGLLVVSRLLSVVIPSELSPSELTLSGPPELLGKQVLTVLPSAMALSKCCSTLR